MALNSNSRTSNVSRNAISALANKIAILLLTLISRRIFIQYIGVEYLGINGLFANILTLLSMADLGLGTAMNVSLYKPIAENDEKKLSAIVNYFRTIYFVIAAAVTIIGVSLVPVLKYIVNMEQDIPNLYLFYILFVVKSAVSYLFVYKSSLISADQKSYKINTIEIYVSVVKIILQIIFIIATKNYLLYLLIDIGAVVAHNVSVSLIADKEYPFIKQRVALSKEDKKSIFEDVYSAFLYRLGGSILGGTDSIIISIMVGTIAVGLYSNYSVLITNLENFIVLLFTALTASIGNLVATSSTQKRYSTYKSIQMVADYLGALLTINVFYLLQDTISIWLGNNMLLSTGVVVAFSVKIYYAICMRPVWTFREGTGMYRQIRYIMLLAAVLNVIFSIALGKIYGIAGILIATTVAKLLSCFFYEPKILFEKFFGVKSIKYYLNFISNLLVTILIGAVCYYPMQCIDGTYIIGWIVKGCINTAIVSLVFFIKFRNTEEFNNMKEKIYVLLRKINIKTL